MYADDTHTTIASDDTNELAQIAPELSGWTRVDKLSANPKKIDLTLIGHPCRINDIETLAKKN